MANRVLDVFLYPDKVTGSLRVAGLKPGEVADLWQGNTLEFRVLVLNEDNSFYSIEDTSSLTLRIRASQDDDSDILADKTVAFASYGDATSVSDFTEGLTEHATFNLTDAETNIPLLGSPTRRLWVVVKSALSAGGTRTLGAGWMTLNEDNTAAALPPTNIGTAITQDEADARYMGLYTGSTVFINDIQTEVELSGGELVNIYSDAGNYKVRLADASLGRKAHAFAVQLSGGARVLVGENPELGKDGILSVFSGLEIGDNYYLHKSGEISRVPPLTGLVQPIGVAVGDTRVNINLEDANAYRYEEPNPNPIWHIQHNLNRRPAVFVHDGTHEVKPEITHTDEDSLTLTFFTAVSGNAYLT